MRGVQVNIFLALFTIFARPVEFNYSPFEAMYAWQYIEGCQIMLVDRMDGETFAKYYQYIKVAAIDRFGDTSYAEGERVIVVAVGTCLNLGMSYNKAAYEVYQYFLQSRKYKVYSDYRNMFIWYWENMGAESPLIKQAQSKSENYPVFIELTQWRGHVYKSVNVLEQE